MSQITSSHATHAAAHQLRMCRLVNTLSKIRNQVADFRDGFERVRRFTETDIRRLAVMERGYVAAIGRFYLSLSRAMRMLYGKSGPGTPKTINSLEYSRLFARFNCISVVDTGARFRN